MFNKKIVKVWNMMELLAEIPYGTPVNVEVEVRESLDSWIDPDVELDGIYATIRRISDGHPETSIEKMEEMMDEARDEVIRRYGNFF